MQALGNVDLSGFTMNNTYAPRFATQGEVTARGTGVTAGVGKVQPNREGEQAPVPKKARTKKPLARTTPHRFHPKVGYYA